ncbi:uncharacterized protein involved in exopolysaccharide biosynthesis [Spirosoma lacussanchae]|uniref:GumC family protein n=1 Tax=Spirosoma lacussanchae TaxID=1884249 RepID=UPI001108DC58|nr:hypothetical protein [Spirosoma lacussanchae]
MALTMATIVQVVKRWLLWLLLFPAVLTASVAYFTRDMPLEFTSTATVYTGIASGYSITSSESDRIDNTAVNNAFDNLMTTIKSRETLSDVGLRLLAHHLVLRQPRPDQLGANSFKALKALMTPNLKKAIVPGNEEATYERLLAMLKQPEGNTVKSLLYQSGTPYAVESILGRITSSRKGNSDMLDLSCKGTDPAICQQTLLYLIGSFKRRYTSFKTSETGSVVGYFEDQTQTALRNLKAAEDRLTKYSIDNKIINYGEQSKYTAAAKEGITTEYYQEKRNLETANAALGTLNQRITNLGSVLVTNKALNDKRAELDKAQTQLSNAMVYGYSKEAIDKLRATTNRVSDELKGMVARYYDSTHTLESVPQQELMGKYLDNTLENRGATVRLKTMQDRIKEFDQVYDVMAPQGSAIGRFQREISLAEREYFDALHSLNQARLRQKDLEMSGAMTVLDAPSLPMKPLPSSRRMLIIAAGLGGFVLILSIALGQVMLNKSIASPERVEPLTSIPLAAALPLRLPRLEKYDLDFAEHSMLEQLRSRILVDIQEAGLARHSYHLILIFSTRPQQGKTWVGSRISDLFAESGKRVAYLRVDELLNPATSQAKLIAYPQLTNLADVDRLAEFMESTPEQTLSDYDYIFLELPALLNTPMPVQLIGQCDMSVLVVSARTSWSQADQELATLYRRAAYSPVVAVLNDVEPDRLETLMGPLAKRKRELARKKEKKVRDKAAEKAVVKRS